MGWFFWTQKKPPHQICREGANGPLGTFVPVSFSSTLYPPPKLEICCRLQWLGNILNAPSPEMGWFFLDHKKPPYMDGVFFLEIQKKTPQKSSVHAIISLAIMQTIGINNLLICVVFDAVLFAIHITTIPCPLTLLYIRQRGVHTK